MYTEMHGSKDKDKILMATESTEEHGKIKILKSYCQGNTRKDKIKVHFATEIHGIKNA